MSACPADRRDRLPRHGGARAAARAHRPRGPLRRPRADDAAAEARLDGVLATLYGDPSPYRGRVTARSRGDLTGRIDAPDAQSTSSATAPRRSRSTSRSSEARAINVEGTRAMLALARAVGARRFVHVSTAYVAGTHTRPLHRGHARRPSSATPTSRRSARRSGSSAPSSDGMEVAIARPSIVMGESGTGWTPAFNVLYWPLRAFARGLFEPVPALPDGRVDVVPVDYVADGIAKLIENRRHRHVQPRRRGATPRRSTSSPTLACAHFDRRGRRTRRPAARRAPLPTSTAPSTCRTSTWRSCSTTRARASSSGCSAPKLRAYFDTCMDYATIARSGASAARRATQARGTYAASSVGRAPARACRSSAAGAGERSTTTAIANAATRNPTATPNASV